MGVIYCGSSVDNRSPSSMSLNTEHTGWKLRILKIISLGLSALTPGSNGVFLSAGDVALMTRVNTATHCPNVVQLIEWFDRRTRCILILERPVPCQDLQFLQRLDEILAKKVLVQLISTPKHCESCWVLHRDVTPENLLT